MANNSNRGLANADSKTRKDVARKGGQAYHEKRGQKGSDNTQKSGS